MWSRPINALTVSLTRTGAAPTGIRVDRKGRRVRRINSARKGIARTFDSFVALHSSKYLVPSHPRSVPELGRRCPGRDHALPAQLQ